MAYEIKLKVYYPDDDNNVQVACGCFDTDCFQKWSFHTFVTLIHHAVGFPSRSMICESIKKFEFHRHYRIFWIDADNDKVPITCHSYQVLKATNGIQKLHIEKKDNSPVLSDQSQSQPSPSCTQSFNSTNQTVVHDGVRCDNCDATPIVGIRYKCAQCYDYDLCEKCLQMKVHTDHVMFRFPLTLQRYADSGFFKTMQQSFRQVAYTEQGHDGPSSGCEVGGKGTFNQLCTKGKYYHDNQNSSTGPVEPPQPEAEAHTKKPNPSNASKPDEILEGNQSDINNAGDIDNRNEFPVVNNIYGQAVAEALKVFSENITKLFDPLCITVNIVDKKDGSQQNSSKSSTCGHEKQSQETPPPQNIEADAQQPEMPASGTQTPNRDFDSPVSTSTSIISFDSQQSVSAAVEESALSTGGIPVVASDASQQNNSNEEKAMKIDAEDAAENSSTDAAATNKNRGSTPVEASWTMIEKQFGDLRVHGQLEVDNQPTLSDSQQKQSQPESVNFSQLSKDILSHITQAYERTKKLPDEQQQKRPDPKPVGSFVHHPDIKINDAVIAMMALGFNNRGGWLANLLENLKGQILDTTRDLTTDLV